MLEDPSDSLADILSNSPIIAEILTTHHPTATIPDINNAPVSPSETTSELSTEIQPETATEIQAEAPAIDQPETAAEIQAEITGASEPVVLTEPYVADLLTETVQGVQQVLAEMQLLKQDFDTKVKYDESKERLIDVLHNELQGYREGLHFKILRPLFMELITLYDDMNSIIESMGKKFPDLDETIIKNIQSFSKTVEDMLSNNGVEAFEIEEEIFVTQKQRVLHVIPTHDVTLDRHIARRLRKGFRYENRILRPEIVETYRYTTTS
ncbi:nucleotide exchange factor GrpE [Dictyobacter arantiisoli]|uniref:Nucleotide exchange factor GrpE n=1 Tax=Dictyobacter arantiisoli TaxID=2014874 RepID=A0A5A5TBV0_9CHLR|nr:nucleotide exchange factor GrpE [Dictyobacter arantiisoli]GCF08705.1 hypothetical protein KDI_22690 [Dictyobacter arantiisoli]